jgi:transcriptional regulator with XRE-family HTH domain
MKNPKTAIPQKFGKAFKKALDDRGLTLRGFAASSGMEYAHIQRIAAGKVNLALSSIISLAEGLDMSFAELATYYDKIKTK